MISRPLPSVSPGGVSSEIARSTARPRNLHRGRVFLGGEPMQPSNLLELPIPRPEFVNNYGPTECTATATFYRVPSDLEQYHNRSVPIGKPIANARIYILDSHQHLVPIGVSGEIYIGGVPVGRGYLNQPELTAKCFVHDPFISKADAKMYKTGDLGRWLADGTIEYIGRNDFQVKIRGFRIELGEIEAALRQHPQLREVVVDVYEPIPDDKRLVAYLVSQDTSNPTPSELRNFLKPKLPEFMVPSAFVFLDALPLTSNGKLNRKALPAPDQSNQNLQVDFVAPRSPVENQLAEIWHDVLKIDRVGIHDNFFDLGGHSLLAMQVIVRVDEQLSVEISLDSLFKFPTIEELAKLIENTEAGISNRPKRITTQQRSVYKTDKSLTISATEKADSAIDQFISPLSFAQQGLWLVDKLKETSANYNIYRVQRLRGRLDVDALELALNTIIHRHEALRTYFTEQDGIPMQVIQSSLSMPLPIVDFCEYSEERKASELIRLVQENKTAAFNLKRGPLLRAQLLRLGKEEYIFLFAFHHIISDGWSVDVFVHELSALYAALSQGQPSPLPELPIQYADYVVWQREWLQGEAMEQLLDYWKTQLADVSTLELPTDKPRPAVQSLCGEQQKFSLSPDLVKGLKALNRQEGVTLFMTLIATFQVLLHRYSGQDDIVIGTASAGRSRLELESLIGFFVNTLVMRADMSGNPSFHELLMQMREVTLGAFAHQDMPFEKLIQELRLQPDRSRNPLFQVWFVLQNTDQTELQLNNLSVECLLTIEESAKFDLALYVFESSEGIECHITYATDLFEAATITRLIGHFQMLLEGIIAHPEARLSELPLLTESENQQLLVEWNATTVELPDAHFIHSLFEQQVERTPQAVAAVYQDQPLTYGELNAKANQLAHHLRTIGVGSEVRVGICVERSLDMVVGLLAILKAGGACVPFDPAYPEERIAFMLQDSNPVALLTQSKFAPLFADIAETLPIIDLHETVALWANQPVSNLNNNEVGLNPESLAYIIYTSGSTGKPKGTCVLHKGLQNLITWHIHESQLSSNDAVLIVTSCAYVFTQRAIFSALLAGARLVLATEPFDSQAIMGLLVKEHVSMINITQSGLNALITVNADGHLSRLRRITLAGEPMNPSQLLALSKPRPEIVNNYGATECAGTAIYYQVPPNLEYYRDRSMPIGKPIWNTRIYILDSYQQPVPIGVVGEIHIGGAPVGRGYLNQPEMTAERFVHDPFSAQADAMMYKTGDLGRWLADGTIEYRGRNDFQVKIRGFRVELGEIESALRQHPQLREAVVGVYERVSGDKHLAAYVVPQGTVIPTPLELRDFLKPHLPEFMIPSAFVFLDALPLTPNGKLDRQALPAPDQSHAEVRHSYVPPRSPIEEMLVAIWQDILNIDQIGIHDNFFELGGHSLLAMQLLVRINKHYQLDFPLYLLFEEPTIAGLATLLTAMLEQTSAVYTPIATINRDLPILASFAQQRLWFLDRLLGASGLYNISRVLQLNGDLNVPALQQSLKAIVARHEVLRTYFAEQDAEPIQVIKASMPFECPLIDLSALPQPQQHSESQAILQTEENKAFDLKQAPLIRALLIKLSAQQHILLVTIHHIVSDGWSMGVFRQELAAFYAAFSQNKTAELPELPIQYADYAVWQREWLQGEVLEKQLSYWKSQLAELTVLELPTDKPRPKQQSYQGTKAAIHLSADLTQGLKTLSQQQNVTLFMTLLAAFQVVLHRYSGQEDIVVGTAIAGRNRQELENMIGFFVNTLALRTDLSGTPSFEQLLSRVRAVCLDAYAHQEMPCEKLVAELQVQRDMSRNPLFQVLLVLQPADQQDVDLTGLTVNKLSIPHDSAKFDLAISLREQADGLTGTIEYNTDLFTSDTIARLAGHFQTLLTAVVAHPNGMPLKLTIPKINVSTNCLRRKSQKRHTRWQSCMKIANSAILN
ncbi:MAG: amino acid adenylation domain-containing protein [Methylococcaceae bacterium NSP1-2]|nr:MAG: amino acid adenylation domain-containing protein [Methylococcaceae bacterium NSP1-2]